MKKTAKRLLIFVLIQFSKCDMEAFIVGGGYVDISMYPHSGFLQVKCQGKGNWVCGSAVLNQKIIITAAHCVRGCEIQTDPPCRIILYLGDTNVLKVTIKRKVIDLRIHPDYNDVTLDNDIAVAAVKKKFPLGPNVKRVVISEKFPNSAYAFDTYVAGWGVINENHDNTLLLKHVSQKIRSWGVCVLIGLLHNGMFCASSTGNTADHPAPGDSGSPLVTASRYHQVGLVSFVVSSYPTLMVYTNISYYYEWITENSKILYCKN